MSYFVTSGASNGQLAQAINYILANLGTNYASNQNTGIVTTSTTQTAATSSVGQTTSYLYRYLYVAYADNYAGNVNFSSYIRRPSGSYTGSQYYGLRNSNSNVYASPTPADFVWYQVNGGFGASNSLWYQIFGGLQINLVVASSAPTTSYAVVPDYSTNGPIDLTLVGSSTNLQARSAFAVYTGTLGNTPPTFTTTGSSTFPPPGTWGGSITPETWYANPSTYNAGQNLWEIDGIYNPITNLTLWASPYIATLKVGSLSAINANLGTITAGSLSAVSISGGSSPPVIDSTNHTISSGSGITLNSNGTFGIGNSSANIVFDSSGTAKVNATNLSAISANLGSITAGTATFTQSSGNYIIIDGTNQRIDVYNSGVLRVRIGQL
jgi:hypothetical protein